MPSRNSRASDTRLPAAPGRQPPPASRVPLPPPAAAAIAIGDGRYVKLTSATVQALTGDLTLAGSFLIAGTDPNANHLSVYGAVLQSDDIFVVGDSTATAKYLQVANSGIVYWGGKKSYLGVDGEQWIGGLTDLFGFKFSAVYTVDLTTAASTIHHTAWIGDGSSRFPKLAMYRDTGSALAGTAVASLHGGTGALEIDLGAATATAIKATAHASQTADVVCVQPSTGTAWFVIASNGDATFNRPVDIPNSALNVGDALDVGNGITVSGGGVSVESDELTLASGASVNEFSTDGTLGGNSDSAVPTEKAVKAYVDAEIAKIIP